MTGMENIFYNRKIDKTELKRIIRWYIIQYGALQANFFLDKLKIVGFHSATLSGISLGLEDLKTPLTKVALLDAAHEKIQQNESCFTWGVITPIERFQRIIEVWTQTSETLKNDVVSYFQEIDPLNSLYVMAFSGARGNISQVRQLVGMRGLMSDPQGQIIDLPIQTNFREGLGVTEYMISCYGARKGLVDTALGTAHAGYLTRRLIDVAHSLIIDEVDCQTNEGIFIQNPNPDNIIGRVSSETLIDIKKFESWTKTQTIQNNTDLKSTVKKFSENFFILKRNQDITPMIATKLSSLLEISEIPKVLFDKNEFVIFNKLKNDLDSTIEHTILKNRFIFSLSSSQFISKGIFIRSPLTCQSFYKKNLCQLCYGWNLSYRRLVPLGDAIGILAAQSIGEPGTQLTMRTFHTGGIFTGTFQQRVEAFHSGYIGYSRQTRGAKVRLLNGQPGFITLQQSEILIYENTLEIKTIVSKILLPAYSLLYVSPGQRVLQSEIIAAVLFVSIPKSNIEKEHKMGTLQENLEDLQAPHETILASSDGEISLGNLAFSESDDCKYFPILPYIVVRPSFLFLLQGQSIFSSVFIFLKKGDFFRLTQSKKLQLFLPELHLEKQSQEFLRLFQSLNTSYLFKNTNVLERKKLSLYLLEKKVFQTKNFLHLVSQSNTTLFYKKHFQKEYFSLKRFEKSFLPKKEAYFTDSAENLQKYQPNYSFKKKIRASTIINPLFDFSERKEWFLQHKNKTYFPTQWVANTSLNESISFFENRAFNFDYEFRVFFYKKKLPYISLRYEKDIKIIKKKLNFESPSIYLNLRKLCFRRELFSKIFFKLPNTFENLPKGFKFDIVREKEIAKIKSKLFYEILQPHFLRTKFYFVQKKKRYAVKYKILPFMHEELLLSKLSTYLKKKKNVLHSFINAKLILKSEFQLKKFIILGHFLILPNFFNNKNYQFFLDLKGTINQKVRIQKKDNIKFILQDLFSDKIKKALELTNLPSLKLIKCRSQKILDIHYWTNQSKVDCQSIASYEKAIDKQIFRFEFINLKSFRSRFVLNQNLKSAFTLKLFYQKFYESFFGNLKSIHSMNSLQFSFLKLQQNFNYNTIPVFFNQNNCLSDFRLQPSFKNLLSVQHLVVRLENSFPEKCSKFSKALYLRNLSKEIHCYSRILIFKRKKLNTSSITIKKIRFCLLYSPKNLFLKRVIYFVPSKWKKLLQSIYLLKTNVKFVQKQHFKSIVKNDIKIQNSKDNYNKTQFFLKSFQLLYHNFQDFSNGTNFFEKRKKQTTFFSVSNCYSYDLSISQKIKSIHLFEKYSVCSMFMYSQDKKNFENQQYWLLNILYSISFFKQIFFREKINSFCLFPNLFISHVPNISPWFEKNQTKTNNLPLFLNGFQFPDLMLNKILSFFKSKKKNSKNLALCISRSQKIELSLNVNITFCPSLKLTSLVFNNFIQETFSSLATVTDNSIIQKIKNFDLKGIFSIEYLTSVSTKINSLPFSSEKSASFENQIVLKKFSSLKWNSNANMYESFMQGEVQIASSNEIEDLYSEKIRRLFSTSELEKVHSALISGLPLNEEVHVKFLYELFRKIFALNPTQSFHLSSYWERERTKEEKKKFLKTNKIKMTEDVILKMMDSIFDFCFPAARLSTVGERALANFKFYFVDVIHATLSVYKYGDSVEELLLKYLFEKPYWFDRVNLNDVTFFNHLVSESNSFDFSRSSIEQARTSLILGKIDQFSLSTKITHLFEICFQNPEELYNFLFSNKKKVINTLHDSFVPSFEKVNLLKKPLSIKSYLIHYDLKKKDFKKLSTSKLPVLIEFIENLSFKKLYKIVVRESNEFSISVETKDINKSQNHIVKTPTDLKKNSSEKKKLPWKKRYPWNSFLSKKKAIRSFKTDFSFFSIGSLVRFGPNQKDCQIYNKDVKENSYLAQIIKKTSKKILFRIVNASLLPTDAHFSIWHGKFIQTNEILFSFNQQKSKTGDIVQGLPKINRLFEVRRLNQTANDSTFVKTSNKIVNKNNFFEKTQVKQNLKWAQNNIQERKFGQLNLLTQIQSVYISQGVSIADKHLEVIIRQMTSKVLILSINDLGFLPGDTIDTLFFQKIYCFSQNPIFCTPLLLGISKLALKYPSILAPASFQETKRILVRSALASRVDFLSGLKEHVMIGNIIPSGTGFEGNEDFQATFNFEQPFGLNSFNEIFLKKRSYFLNDIEWNFLGHFEIKSQSLPLKNNLFFSLNSKKSISNQVNFYKNFSKKTLFINRSLRQFRHLQLDFPTRLRLFPQLLF